MIKRTIEIANPAYLSVKHRQLIIKNDQGEHSIAFEDIGFLILDHPQITVTQAVMRCCAEETISMIVTNEQHLPNAQLMSMQSNNLQGKVMRAQVQVDVDIKVSLWQQIVKAKIAAQNHCLSLCGYQFNNRLTRLETTITADSAGSFEAQAAKIYFRLLFGEGFRRNPDSDGINSLLNYGYTVLRSACARSLALTGLHPAFGLQHHNQYNVFCLADDIMEPLRPLVDYLVYQQCSTGSIELDRTVKNELLQLLNQRVLIKERKLPLMSSLQEYSSSLKSCLIAGKKRLLIPQCE